MTTFTAIFKASGGSTLLAGLEHLTKKMSDFLNSARGQNDIRAVFAAMNWAAETLWGIVVQLAPVVHDILISLGPVLKQALRDAIGLLQTVAQWLHDHRDTIAKWAPLIAQAMIALKLISMAKWIADTLYLTTLLKGIWTWYGKIRTAQEGAAAVSVATSTTEATAAGAAAGTAFRGGLLRGLAPLIVEPGPVAAVVLTVMFSIQGFNDAKKGKGPFDLIKDFMKDPSWTNAFRGAAFFSPVYWISTPVGTIAPAHH